MNTDAIERFVMDMEHDSDDHCNSNTDIAKAYSEIASLWVIRTLILMLDNNTISKLTKSEVGIIADTLDIKWDQNVKPSKIFMKTDLIKKSNKYTSLKKPKNCSLHDNLGILKDNLRLSNDDYSILEFFLVLRKHAVLHLVINALGSSFDTGEALITLEKILAIPSKRIKSALSKDSKLVSSGLIMNMHSTGSIIEKYYIMSKLVDAVSLENKNVSELISELAEPAPEPKLAMADFEEIRDMCERVQRHVLISIENRKEGCNILFYGEPGVGKTQLVYCIAKEIGITLLQVANQESNGSPLHVGEQLEVMNLTQKLLKNSNKHAVIFDEVEDAFIPSYIKASMEMNKVGGKGWINSLLENNSIPTFWVCNNIGHIDPAHIRRFDYVCEITNMSSAARERALVSTCKNYGVYPGSWIKKAAKSQHLTPALIEKSVSVTASDKASCVSDSVETFEMVANGFLSAMGSPTLNLSEEKKLLPYDHGYLQTNHDLTELIDGLVKNKLGSLLFYGASGTGKSAFVECISSQIDMPIQRYMASDILSPYVGESEINISNAFNKAKNDKAILLFEEMEALVRQRSSKTTTWENTLITEMLGQLEKYPGIFVACTNHINAIDRAVLRRYDVKIQFEEMSNKIAWKLFKDTLKYHDVEYSETNELIKHGFSSIKGVNFGDFYSAIKKLTYFSSKGIQPNTLLAEIKSLVDSRRIINYKSMDGEILQ